MCQDWKRADIFNHLPSAHICAGNREYKHEKINEKRRCTDLGQNQTNPARVPYVYPLSIQYYINYWCSCEWYVTWDMLGKMIKDVAFNIICSTEPKSELHWETVYHVSVWTYQHLWAISALIYCVHQLILISMFHFLQISVFSIFMYLFILKLLQHVVLGLFLDVDLKVFRINAVSTFEKHSVLNPPWIWICL